MKELDKGTIVRTVALVLALVNQVLVLFKKSPLPLDSEIVEQAVALLFTIITSIVAWFKNNYVTSKGKQQKKVLCENGLAKAEKSDGK
ncbi:phage holin [Lentibacillus sp. Marseille-P4043]|uniref:phage holin n=1 Tax=Lentibacillus sp. Marseille-P4043 TaxID=2040293 RepID=UPI000D0B22BF|nr:phage holin [Lentibacillus sp. Marseille-P4043]